MTHPDIENDRRAQHLAARLAPILTARGEAGATVAELYEALRAGGYVGGVFGVVMAVQWAVTWDRSAAVGPDSQDRFYDPRFAPQAKDAAG